MRPPKVERALRHVDADDARVSEVGATTDGRVWIRFTLANGEQWNYMIDRDSCERLMHGVPNCLAAIDGANN